MGYSCATIKLLYDPALAIFCSPPPSPMLTTNSRTLKNDYQATIFYQQAYQRYMNHNLLMFSTIFHTHLYFIL